MRQTKTIALVIGLTLCVVSGCAPSRTSISGAVADPRGARMPGVEVVLSSVSNGRSEVARVTTDRTGTYQMPRVAPGMYEITATMPGFEPSTYENVTAVEGQPLRFDFSLALRSR